MFTLDALCVSTYMYEHVDTTGESANAIVASMQTHISFNQQLYCFNHHSSFTSPTLLSPTPPSPASHHPPQSHNTLPSLTTNTSTLTTYPSIRPSLTTNIPPYPALQQTPPVIGLTTDTSTALQQTPPHYPAS